MLTTILSISLPILLSIIAARIDSTLNDWVKSDDSAEGGRFYLDQSVHIPERRIY